MMGALGKQIRRTGGSLSIHIICNVAATIFLFCGAQSIALADNAIHRDHDPLHRNEAPSCPSGTFQIFLNIFSESAEVQKSFTHFPIKVLTVVDDVPEPKPVVKSLNESQTSFPLIPNVKERKLKKLAIRVEKQDARRFKVNLSKDDTGYLVSYFFAMNKSCWQLIRIEDWSI